MTDSEKAESIIKLINDYDINSTFLFGWQIEFIEKLCRKQLNNGWIPVSEKLPEDRFNENGEPVEYNVMLRRATEPTTLSIDEHGKWFDWRGHYYNIASLMAYELDVIAWQPLPEPWREEKHD